ncbi:hypothetical protein ABZ442_05055 [Streptomyces triculaminicus]|uniref:hypothetical protein n=1 Tax=Streptomyces triculaminicus TaxID=2816232 RepID=UPI003403ADE5
MPPAPETASLYRCVHCHEPITGEIVRLLELERLGEPGELMQAWHWDRPECRAAVVSRRRPTTAE